ncbi:putative e3 ubiquitin-protein ligase hip1 [Nicotiana attenuata]|uniref:RING-type E3 ubiquitin transferase n=1 Tax=Nicotiana attenuata TaxID=49451 RepID=A0A1J6K597_NICAT|nr:putative e3 ubiquitin-protein ligase hip1 [Nicotiana attenuata]
MSQDHHQHPYFATRTLPNDVFHLQRMNRQQPYIGISDDTPNMFEYWEITTYSDPSMDIDDGEERAGCFICFFEFQNGDSLLTLPCGDVFHLDCFYERLRKRRNDCPFCSAEEEEETFEIETRTYYATVMEIDDEELEQETCAICLCEYEDEDTIGKLQCGHEFHVGCVNKWLQHKKSCPFCRAQVLAARDSYIINIVNSMRTVLLSLFCL